MLHTNGNVINIWIAECFSCQVDLIDLIKSSKNLVNIKIFSSHTIDKHELRLSSDEFTVQPQIKESAEWLLNQCINQRISLLFLGKKGVHVEHLRDQFEAHGIQLITGSLGVETHHSMDDKHAFTTKCIEHDIQVVPALKVESTEDLINAINETKLKFVNVCAKPVFGVYGFGFVRLDDEVSKFRHIEDPLVCNTQWFIDAYAEEKVKRPYLVMPYIDQEECSVDIACSKGEIISKVTRIKYEDHQKCFVDFECDAMAERLVELFKCDGLINIQFKKHNNGQWYVLEINNRPSGGFYYTQHTGVNLVEELLCNKLKITKKFNLPTTNALVRTRITSYKAEN